MNIGETIFFSATFYTVMAYITLFSVLALAIYYNIKEKAFKYYAFYGLGLLLYLLTKQQHLDNFLYTEFNSPTQINLQHIFNWHIQVVFYFFYALFVINLLDLHRKFPKQYAWIKKGLLSIGIFASLLAIFCQITLNSQLFEYFFLYVFVPVMLFLTIYVLRLAVKHSGNQRYFVLFGVIVYILSALLALILSMNNITFFGTDPLVIWFIGIIIENFSFCLGLASKVKELAVERSAKKRLRAEKVLKNEIINLQGVVVDEQMQRQKLAQNLNDGLGGMLVSIKDHFESMQVELKTLGNEGEFNKANILLEEAFQEVRTVAHNIMPDSLVQLGLEMALQDLANNTTQNTPITVTYNGSNHLESLPESKKIMVFRIIETIVKRALLKDKGNIDITIQLNEYEFTINLISTTINLQELISKNIFSRIKYLRGRTIKSINNHVQISFPAFDS